MKIYSGERYEVAEKTNAYKLADTFATYDEAIAAMELAKKKEVANGYTPTNFIIIKTVWSKVFSDDGMFYSYNTQTFRVEP